MSIRRRRLLIATAAVVAVTAIASYFLYSPDPAVSAVLVKFWTARPESCGRDIGCTPRCALVKQLSQMPGDAPRAALVRLLRWHLFVGPRTRRYVYEDADYTGVMREGLKALTIWPDDPAVLRLAHALTEGERLYPKTTAGVQEGTHRIVLLHEMHMRGIQSDDKAIEYLVSQITGSGRGHKADWAKPGLLAESSARNVALGFLLEEYGQAALPALRRALKQAGTPPARQEGLRVAVGLIEIRPVLERLNRRSQPPPDRGLRR